MKYLLFILMFTALAFAANDGCTETSVSVVPHGSGSDDVILTLLNDWPLSQQVLGLDVYDAGSPIVLGSDRNGMQIQAYNSSSGAPMGTLPLASGNANCFGVAWNNDPDTDTYLTNDWTDTYHYFTEDFGVSWSTVASPNGNAARGMDFDGTDYWCTNASGGGLYRFQPGVGAENIAIPEVPSQPSGLTVFTYASNLGVAVTTYNDHYIYFYEWDGTTMSYIGSAACPVSGLAGSYGLAYSEATGTIFWGYASGSTYHLAEFSFNLTALERSSWGAIKSSF